MFNKIDIDRAFASKVLYGFCVVATFIAGVVFPPLGVPIWVFSIVIGIMMMSLLWMIYEMCRS